MLDLSSDQTIGGVGKNSNMSDSKNSGKSGGKKSGKKGGSKKGGKNSGQNNSNFFGFTAMPDMFDSYEPDIKDILINYNEKFADALPAKYRDKEIFTVITHLMMSQKSCSLLIGAPGTGKTKIVEEIARNIAAQSPYTNSLNDYTVYL